MKPWMWGALGAVLVIVVAFWVGRQSVPDRSAELEAWRDSAQMVLEAADARAVAAQARDSARLAESEARFVRERQRVALVTARVGRSEAATDSLRARLEIVQASADSAGIILVQAGIIAQQDTTIRILRADRADAWEAMAGIRSDLATAREELAGERRENGVLRATIAAGLEATKPSRGRTLGFLDCVGGPTATRAGLEYFGVSCGVSMRELVGSR